MTRFTNSTSGVTRILTTNLPPGRHIVTIVTSGEKNERSTDSYVQIVDFE
jgi:hypothetical protein